MLTAGSLDVSPQLQVSEAPQDASSCGLSAVKFHCPWKRTYATRAQQL
jgi:hypothetical protein